MAITKSQNTVLKYFIVLLVVCVVACGCEKNGNSEQPRENPRLEIEIELVELDLEVDGVSGATPPREGMESISPPHLRKMDKDQKREPFMVVPDLENLALYKPVTLSEEPIIGEPEQINDGIKSSDEFDFVEGPGWVQVDLEESAAIHAVVIWHYYNKVLIFNDVIVQISDDADFKQNVTTLFNNDHDNSAKMGKGPDTAYISSAWGEIIDARDADIKPAAARYVRVYTGKSTDGVFPRYIEVAVYGKPASDK